MKFIIFISLIAASFSTWGMDRETQELIQYSSLGIFFPQGQEKS